MSKHNNRKLYDRRRIRRAVIKSKRWIVDLYGMGAEQ